MFTAQQLQTAIDGTPQHKAVTECGCGIIYLTSYDVDHVELSCAYAGDAYGASESYALSLYTDAELLTELNEYAQEWSDDLNREIA